MYPARLTSELAIYALVSTKGGRVEFNCSKLALTQWLSWSTSANNSFGVAHTSPHIHQINTPLWIRSCLPTRTPSITLTLILCILEYPLHLSMNNVSNTVVHYHGCDYSNRSFITLQGCTSSHTLSPLIAVYTTCTRQPSSGSPPRVSSTNWLTTQASSPDLSPIRVPFTRRSGRGVAHGP